MKVLLIAAGFWVLAGCSADEREGLVISPQPALFGVPESKSKPQTLAHENTIVIDIAESEIDSSYKRTVEACAQDNESQCTLLASSINTGEYPSASIRARLLPIGVEPLVGVASKLGRIIRRNTSAEDLAKPIFDQEERKSMLEQYMADLMALRVSARDDVDALIRLASEIAKTQSQLESTRGERAHLQLRVDTTILNLRFVVDQQRGFWSPIGRAIGRFTDDLADGIGSAITGIAYVVPWLIVLVPLFYLIRFLWRRTR